MGLYAYWKVTRRFYIMIIQGVKTSMEKNRLRPTRIPGSKNIRMSYARQKDVLDMPNLIEVQKDSYKWFLTDGLKEVLRTFRLSRITADSSAWSLWTFSFVERIESIQSRSVKNVTQHMQLL